MHLLERIEEYTQDIKKNSCVYEMQKSGIEVLSKYITNSGLNVPEDDFDRQMLNKLLLYWLPRNKKYLSDVEAYQIIYTIQDIYRYIKTKSQIKEKETDTPTILESYGQEYMRVYKAKNMLLKMTKDPVVSVNPIVIALDKYKEKKKKNNNYTDLATTYEQAIFKVQECKEGGQVILTKLGQDKPYKLLLEYPVYKYLKVGDMMHAVIKRKLFYVYWEVEELKFYYLPQAREFLVL